MVDNLGALWFRIEQLLGQVASGLDRTPLSAQIEIADSLGTLLANAEDALAAQGILGAAFLFSDRNGDGWSLFERIGKREQEDPELARAFEAVTSVSTPYVMRPRSGSKISAAKLRELVGAVFIEVRELQEQASEFDSAEPEFFAWLPRQGLESPFPQERAIRKLFAIHYVGEGELAIALITWRTIQLLARRAAMGVHEMPDASTPGVGLPDSWVGLPLTSLKAARSISGTAAQLIGRSWLEECSALLVGQETQSAACRFAAGLGVDLGETDLLPGTICSLARVYAEAVTGAVWTAPAEMLALFERKARAPLPAYFFWQVGEGRPHAHLVAPVWTSAMNPLRLHDEGIENVQPAVGLALSAVAPIAELEAILAGNFANADETHFINTVTTLNILRQISRPLVEFVFYEPARRREKAAQANQLVAAIMSRNLSHNIGSHVLYHLREELESREIDEVDDSQRPEVLKDRLIANLVKYLQARMDFIALVSSEGKTWPGIVSLDSLRAPFMEGALLLKHIVKSQRVIPPVVSIKINERMNRTAENVDFAVPTGAVGAQAVYSIIENYIRNSAKYGTAPPEVPLEISLTICESEDWPDYWECLLTDNNRSVTESALRVVESFDSPIFNPRDPDQSHRNWGLKEIKIAALFLAGGADAIRGQYGADRPEYSGPRASWVLANEEGDTSNLQFRFYMMQPLGICLLGSAASSAFVSAPLMHIFDTPSAMLHQAVSGQRRYELLVVDAEMIASIGSQRMVDAILGKAMRVAFVGTVPNHLVIARNPDTLPLAKDWLALARLASEYKQPPWHAIGQAWVELRWPGRTTVFASNHPDREPEIVALVDRVVPEFTKLPPPDDAHGWLVWDHSRHQRTKPENAINERFAFHRPVSHPVKVSLGPGDGAWRLKEAACLKIGVIDERIWGSRNKAARDQGYQKVPQGADLFNAWRRAGVDILNAELINEWSRCSDAPNPLIPAGKALVAGKPYDFLVVHRSLIDKAASLEVEHNKIAAQSGPGIRDDYVRDILAWLWQASHRLVITSGRGLEPAYRKLLDAAGAGFVEFSALADALIDSSGDKVGIVKLLRSV